MNDVLSPRVQSA